MSGLASLALGVLCACNSHEVVASSCTLEKGQIVAEDAGLRFDALKLVQTPTGFLAVWSDRRGLWSRALDPQGSPSEQKTSLGERCAGGLDALFLQDALWLGCSRPSRFLVEAREPHADAAHADAAHADAAHADADLGSLHVYRFERGAQTANISVGAVGRDGSGLSLREHGQKLHVVYHEGSPELLRIQEAVVDPQSARLVSLESLSASQRIAAHPSSYADGAHHYAVWSETFLSSDDKTRTSVWVKRDGASPKRVLETSVTEAGPSLSDDGQGLVLAFRDKKPKDKRSELYLQRLDAALRPQGTATRVGRANGEGAPKLARCGAVQAAVVPREYGGEHYIAVHELSSQLQSLGGGHQYYANTREFVLADVACAEHTMTLLIGERASPSAPGVELMTLRFACR